jgi:hypothetical protein
MKIYLSIKDMEAKWMCNKCGNESSASTVREMLKALQNEIDEQCQKSEMEHNIVEYLESSLEEYEGLLHPNHYIIISIKNALIDSYGHREGYLLSELPDVLLRRKIDLCEELLAILDVFESGKSRARALMMYELHAPLVLFAKSQYEGEQLTKLEFLELLQKARLMLNDCLQILEWEDENIFAIVKSTRKSIENVDRLIEMLKTNDD